MFTISGGVVDFARLGLFGSSLFLRLLLVFASKWGVLFTLYSIAIPFPIQFLSNFAIRVGPEANAAVPNALVDS